MDPNSNAFFGSLNQLMTPMTNYWLVLSVPVSNGGNTSRGVTSTPTGTGSGFQAIDAFSGNQGATWSTTSGQALQTQITTTGVPEPSTWALIAGGLLTLLGVQRVRRGAVH